MAADAAGRLGGPGAGGGATDPDDVLLRVRGLTVRAGERTLVDGIDLDLRRGERVGLIGDSGSGKSLTCLSIMGLLGDGLERAGTIELAGAASGVDGPGVAAPGSAAGVGASGVADPGDAATPIDLATLDDRAMARLRGRRLGMVFQEPMTALDPLMRVGDQVAEACGGRGRGISTRVADLLARMGLPERVARAWPHELSGGQRQRVVLAMAMANTPDLLLADEPTTALDTTVQRRMLDLMREQVADAHTSLLFVTHDLGVVAGLCERVLVMERGRIVEAGPIGRVFRAPGHPCTRRLLAAARLEARPLPRVHAADGIRAETAGTHPVHACDPVEPIIRVDGVTMVYGPVHRRGWPRVAATPALADVTFDVRPGERLGVVGESGSGKSTLLRLIAGLDRPTAGRVTVTGRPVAGSERALRWLRRVVQLVFQDPMGSLDPQMRVGDIVAEGLARLPRAERRQRVAALLRRVGLPEDAAGRHPHRFSGGQRQRIAIARALAVAPRVLLADEAVSALDVTVRGAVLDLLDELVAEQGLTLVFVSHDLGVVRALCDRVIVMHAGRVIEQGPTERVFSAPEQAYTAELLDAMPVLPGA